ncbi:MAG: hypothetical protein U0640_01935 [Phycisphaerales bacterium]
MFKICTCVVMAWRASPSLVASMAHCVSIRRRIPQATAASFSRHLTGFVGITGLFSDINTISFQTYRLEMHENFHPGNIFPP